MPTPERVLITGGAGFVGSHLADALAAAGHEVVLYDRLEPQVHDAARPTYLDPAHRLVIGDVRDAAALAPHLRAADVVFHLAARVGVAQSMYQVHEYVSANTLGFATLLQLLADHRGHVRKLVVASSMSIYGEGTYHCAEHGPVAPGLRSEAQLAERCWEPLCPRCKRPLQSRPTPEDAPLQPTSIYAVTKRDHEEMALVFGAGYQLPTVALRFFNIYGSRQALSNPYTGVGAIFSSRLLNGQPPLVFEDGGQLRDFVHVSDVVQACLLAMNLPAADGQVFNVGTGQPHSVFDVATLLARELGVDLAPEIRGQYRVGDIRHCFADISRIQQKLGYTPRVAFEAGLRELVAWVGGQRGVRDELSQASQELEARNLVR
ncbi:MAG: NAD-dependent epimerase/dehydratase family protein [Chloroflexi bacterium]|nr:NAD-dependent epimerase/dehydratase family protein [Chloroflexota bacterium]